jgi:hypothetical protein
VESGLPLVGPLIEFSSTPRPFLQRLEKQVRAAPDWQISSAGSSLNLYLCAAMCRMCRVSCRVVSCRVVLRACVCVRRHHSTAKRSRWTC